MHFGVKHLFPWNVSGSNFDANICPLSLVFS